MRSNQPIVFEEKQAFTQWWLWLFLGGIIVSIMYKEYTLSGWDFSSRVWLSIGVLLAVMSLFLFMRMRTVVTYEALYVGFTPFPLKCIPWNSVEKAYLRTYRPLVEYGGWGWRWSLFGHGSAFNVQGNQGLQLVLKDGSRKLIGTQNPKALLEAVPQGLRSE